MVDDNILSIHLQEGIIKVKLLPEVAPRHVERVQELSLERSYDDVAFHRVIDGFMAQTGDIVFGAKENSAHYDRAGESGTNTGKSNLIAEFSELPFTRGTVGMARTTDPDSANTQFFIMLEDNYYLNGNYTVFGEVIEGMSYVDQIKSGNPLNNGKVTDPDYMLSVSTGNLTTLKTTKGAAWSGNPIGVKANDVTGGYDLILETVGRKGTSYSEISVSGEGVVARKGSKVSLEELEFLEALYESDLNQDGKILNNESIQNEDELSLYPDADIDDEEIKLELVVETDAEVPEGNFDKNIDNVTELVDSSFEINEKPEEADPEDIGEEGLVEELILKEESIITEDESITDQILEVEQISLVDNLSLTFDDLAKRFDILGLDPDVTSQDLQISITNSSVLETASDSSFTISPSIYVSNGTASISYSDLNRSIQDLVLVDQNTNFNQHKTITAYYNSNGDNIENHGQGSSLIDSGVFEILDFVVTETETAASLKLSTEGGWEYSVEDVESARVSISYDPSELTFYGASFEGLGFVNEVNPGFVEAAIIGSYNSDGASLGNFGFIKLVPDAIQLQISLFEAGGSTAHDYPIGFTIEI